MSPRAYELGKRTAGVAQTRERVIAATRQLLATSSAYSQVSVPAIARAADVSRDTVYRQFGSKSGLLEAVFDDSAERGGLGRLREAFTAPAAVDGLTVLVAVFCRFWSSDPPIHRVLRALGALDPELATALQARDDRRRQGLRVLCGRIAEQVRPCPPPLGVDQLDDTVDLLHTLTGFATYDQLQTSRSAEDVAALLHRAVRDIAHLDPTTAPLERTDPS